MAIYNYTMLRTLPSAGKAEARRGPALRACIWKVDGCLDWRWLREPWGGMALET